MIYTIVIDNLFVYLTAFEIHVIGTNLEKGDEKNRN